MSRQVMHSFCEPYFHAIKRWLKYDTASLFRNRIEILSVITALLNDEIPSPDTISSVELVAEADDLLPEVIPASGRDFFDGADQHAFKEAQTLVSKIVFQIGGLYFQANIMKAIVKQAKQPDPVKTSVVGALETLFRLSQTAGVARLVWRKPDGERQNIEIAALSGAAETLCNDLLQQMPQLQPSTEQAASETNAASGSSAISPVPDASSVSPKKPVAEAENVEVDASKRPARGATQKLTYGLKEGEGDGDGDGDDDNAKGRGKGRGKDKKSASSSSAAAAKGKDKSEKKGAGKGDKKAKDSKKKKDDKKEKPGRKKARKIEDETESEDEEEKEEEEEEEDEEIPWTNEHEYVTNKTRVAAMFSVDVPESEGGGKGRKRKQKLERFFGTVVRYAPESKPKEGDQLYHIQWDDGDEEDYDEKQLNDGIREYMKSQNVENRKAADAKAAAAEAEAEVEAEKEKEKEEEAAAEGQQSDSHATA